MTTILPPHLDPYAVGDHDTHCEHCGRNMSNAYSVLFTACVENPTQCVACCAGACEDCAEAIDTHWRSYRSQRNPRYLDTHDRSGEAA